MFCMVSTWKFFPVKGAATICVRASPVLIVIFNAGSEVLRNT